MALISLLRRNTSITEMPIPRDWMSEHTNDVILDLLDRNKGVAYLLQRRIEVARKKPSSSYSFAELRERCTVDGFGVVAPGHATERALVAAAVSLAPLQRGIATVDAIAADWLTVVLAEDRLVNEDVDALQARDLAVAEFIESSSALDEVESSLSSLPLAVPLAGADVSKAAHLPVCELHVELRKIAVWVKHVDALHKARMVAVSAARDAFIAAHKELGVAIGSDSTDAMKEAEKVCRERARAVEDAAAQLPAVPPSPLDDMPPGQRASLVAALPSRRSQTLREIERLQQHRRDQLAGREKRPAGGRRQSTRKRVKVQA
jgi:hypothetical protein